MAMVRFSCLRNAAAGSLSFITASRASAFLYPGSFLTKKIHNCSLVHQRSCVLQNSNPLFSSKDDRFEPSQGRQLSKSTSSQKKKKKVNKLFRADKVISTRASLSRSQAFDILKRRKVAWKKAHDSELIPIKGPKEKIQMDAILVLDGKIIPNLPPILIAYHKPKFMLSAMQEKHSDKRHLGMILPDKYKKLGIHPVGRLDYDTSGLLLFSMDGDLTQRLLHPKHSIEKEYVATVSGGKVNVEVLKNQLEDQGVITGEGLHFANLLDVQEIGLDESRAIMDDHLKELGEKNENLKQEDFQIPLTNVRIAVQEGKHRMVRRMLANCQHPVIELRRERHGSVVLADLPEGSFRHCEDREIEWAESLLEGQQ